MEKRAAASKAGGIASGSKPAMASKRLETVSDVVELVSESIHQLPAARSTSNPALLSAFFPAYCWGQWKKTQWEKTRWEKAHWPLASGRRPPTPPN